MKNTIHNQNEVKSIVVGGGFGGIAIALRLRALGHQVTLLEKLNTGMIKINPKAIMGSRITCDKNPIIKSLGILSILIKSLVVKPRPRPNIIIPRHIGAIVVAISINYLN